MQFPVGKEEGGGRGGGRKVGDGGPTDYSIRAVTLEKRGGGEGGKRKKGGGAGIKLFPLMGKTPFTTQGKEEKRGGGRTDCLL